MGTHYWGCDYLGYKPDILTMAKHIGNGLPLAAVATSKEIMSSIERNTFSTFGANPVAMAGGREVLKVIDDEGLMERTKKNSKLLFKGLRKIQEKHEVVGDVRG